MPTVSYTTMSTLFPLIPHPVAVEQPHQQSPCSSMTDAQLDPISRPNSALAGPPAIIQLHFVNARLEKNFQPREHFDRQFSVTPERQTPESQQTPLIAWPDIDPIEEVRKVKEWAANAAKPLAQFYAGRVLLQKEEPEKYGIFGEDIEYWESQISHWNFEYKKLSGQYERRKQLEVEGKAVAGYAQALLLSPLQSPSAPASNDIRQIRAPRKEKKKPANVRIVKESVAESQPGALKRRPHPQHPTTNHSSDSNTRVTKGRKRSHAELDGQENEDRSFDKSRLRKRTRKQMLDPTPTHQRLKPGNRSKMNPAVR